MNELKIEIFMGIFADLEGCFFLKTAYFKFLSTNDYHNSTLNQFVTLLLDILHILFLLDCR